jgi:glycosyltransferase involved in cell wall biosynthesis
MGRIGVTIVVGGDVPEAVATARLDALAAYAEREWFEWAVVGPRNPQIPGLRYVPVDAGWAWLSRRGELRRLATEARRGHVIDLYGYQALTWAARGGLLGPAAVYTRLTLPPSPAARRREAWLMRAVGTVVAPGPEWLPPHVPGAQLIPWFDAESPGAPDAPPPSDVQGTMRVVVQAGPDASERVLETLLNLSGVVWEPILGPWHGRPPADDPWAAIRASDVVVLPAREVGDGRLVDAALAAGRPLIASRVPGFVGRFRCPVEGLLVDPDDAEAWRETLLWVLEDGETRQALATQARAAYSRGDAAQAVRMLQSVYAGVLLRATGQCPVCPEAAGGR